MIPHAEGQAGHARQTSHWNPVITAPSRPNQHPLLSSFTPSHSFIFNIDDPTVPDGNLNMHMNIYDNVASDDEI